MSIDGVVNQPIRLQRDERAADVKPAAKPIIVGKGGVPEDDVIDIKAIKAILYLGIRGNVYLPIEEGRTIDTRA